MKAARQPGARRTCPECGRLVPVDPGYLPWCECGWNLRVEPGNGRRSVLARIYRDIGRRRGTALFEAMLHEGPARPGLVPGDLALFALSIPVLVVYLALPVGTILLAVRAHDHPFGWIGIAIFALLTWFLRPRLHSVRKEAVAPRVSYPVLHELVEEICDVLHIAPPRHIEIDGAHNARVERVGPLQRRGLCLGLPLFEVLDSEERVALLAHELAHFANGDPLRWLVPRTAISMLEGWYAVLMPESLWSDRDRVGLSAVLARGFLAALAQVPRAALWALSHLAWGQSQRAEYRADQLGAQVAGTGPVVRMLGFAGNATFGFALHRVVVGGSDRDLVAEYRHQLRNRPPRELERLRRLASAEEPAPDSTHPPMGFRIRLLQERAVQFAMVRLDPARHAELDRELSRAGPRIHAELVGAYEAGLYGLA